MTRARTKSPAITLASGAAVRIPKNINHQHDRQCHQSDNRILVRDDVIAKMSQHRIGQRDSQQHHCCQPDGNEPENLRQRSFFEPAQIRANLGAEALNFIQQFIAIAGSAGFPDARSGG